MEFLDDYLKVQKEIPRLQDWGVFRKRETQFEYCKLMKEFINDVISYNFDKDTLSCIIQITKYGPTDENLEKYFGILGQQYVDKYLKKCLDIPREVRGLTGAARGTIPIDDKFSLEDAEEVRHFLNDIANSSSKDEVISSVNKFSEKEISYVTDGIYSPWLTYLKPAICPIANNTTKEFFKKIGWAGKSYTSIIEFTEPLAKLFTENNYLYLDEIAKRDDISTFLFGTLPPIKKAKTYIGYYLSNWGPNEHGRFKSNQWDDVYALFYNCLNEKQELKNFANSIKGFRDAYDAHVPDSPRRGWHTPEDSSVPAKLPRDRQEVFDLFVGLPEEYIWEVINKFISSEPVETPSRKRYWGGGLGDEGDLEKWMSGHFWKLNFNKNDDSSKAKIAWSSFKEISIGDEFVMRGWGGRNDLVCHYYGEVVEKNDDGLLRLKPLNERAKYKGKAPSGEGAGQWGRTLNEVVREEDIRLIFGNIRKKVKFEDTEVNMAKSKNIILYGPPGTGKTYRSRSLALQLIGEKQDNFVERFNQLQGDKQVEFITFHQSFSYEQFVEGIIPETDEGDENSTISYNVVPGVFKRICQEALCELIIPKEDTIDGKILPSFDEAYAQLVEDVEEIPKNLKTIQGSEFSIKPSARGGMRVDVKDGGGWSIAKETLRKIYVDLISIKAPPYDRKDIKSVTRHSLSSYIMPIVNEIASKSSSKEMGEVSRFKPDEVLKYLEKGTFEFNSNAKQFVLIIDEINRGNISQIFGELITLIEPNKRVGGNEDILLTLPYSKDTFGVPSNLHIIGTMNTADRSVEAMDTALRRRFDFIEAMPSDDSGENLIWHEFESFKVKDIFNAINERIEYFLGRDHTLGHFFFINLEGDKLKDLMNRFSNKIIPLLKEYFYEDWEKIGLILGSGFVKYEEGVPKFAQFVIEGDYSSKAKYSLTNKDSWKEETFLRILKK